MQLSEAIRLGSLIHPQAFGTMRDATAFVVEDGVVRALDARTCALGAAGEAVGIHFGFCEAPEANVLRLRAAFPILNLLEGQCPACAVLFGGGQVVVHLNDFHRWTRERIADFVEIEEGRLAASAPTTAVATSLASVTETVHV